MDKMNGIVQSSYMTTTKRMIECGKIERRRERVQARRGRFGVTHTAAGAAWRAACGRAYRLVSGGYP